MLATIGSTAPFVGLFGTVIGILNAFQQIATQKTSGIGAVAGGISEALVTTAFGLLVAIPAVMAFNYFTGRVEAFDVEMDNSSSELIDYFIKQRQALSNPGAAPSENFRWAGEPQGYLARRVSNMARQPTSNESRMPSGIRIQ